MAVDGRDPETGSKRAGPGMRRRAVGWALTFLLALAPIAIAMVISMGLIGLLGAPPIDALVALFEGAFGGRREIARTLNYVLPLTLVALAWMVALSTRRINIGFEGQMVMAGIGATVVGLYLTAPGPLPLIAATLVATLVGTAYAGLAAWLWARYNVNEIISTLLLNFAALEVLGWVVRGPLQEPDVIYPRSPMLPEGAQWPDLLQGTALTWSFAMAPLAVVAVWLLLQRTSFGFSLKMTGSNVSFAERIGLRVMRLNVYALLLSGALAGLAGGAVVLGSERARLSDGFSGGMGFDGIVVALVARRSPWAVMAVALFFALLRSGGGLMEARVGVPFNLVQISLGVVLILVCGTAFLFERRQVAGEAARVAQAPAEREAR